MLHDYLVMTSWSVEQHNYRAFFNLWAVNLQAWQISLKVNYDHVCVYSKF